MTREEEIKERSKGCTVFYVDSTRNMHTVATHDLEYLLARNEELCGDLEWHKRELKGKVDEIGWLADDKVRLRNTNEELQRRVEGE